MSNPMPKLVPNQHESPTVTFSPTVPKSKAQTAEDKLQLEQKLLHLAIRHADIAKELCHAITSPYLNESHSVLMDAIYEQGKRSDWSRCLTRTSFRQWLQQNVSDTKLIIPYMNVYDKCDLKGYAVKDDYDSILAEWRNAMYGTKFVDLVSRASTTSKTKGWEQAFRDVANDIAADIANSPGQQFLMDNPLTPNSLLADISDDAADFIYEGIIKAGSNAMLVSPWKAGKSTWLCSLLPAIADGTSFALPTTQTRVLWISEENRSNWADKTMLRHSDNLFIYTRDAVKVPTSDEQWREYIGELARYCQAEHVGLLVIDTISHLFGLDDENDNAKVSRRLRELNRINVHGTAILLVHHATKSSINTESAVISGRGAGAFSAFTDCNILLKSDKASQSAVIKWEGRYGTGEQHFRFDPATGYAPTNSSNPVTVRTDEYLKILGNDTLTVQDIDAATWTINKPNLRTIRRDLQKLAKYGVLLQAGKGSHEQPYVYSAVDMTAVTSEW